MGRPPIGERAMTGAERVRKYRERHPVTKSVTQPSNDVVTKSVNETHPRRARRSHARQHRPARSDHHAHLRARRGYNKTACANAEAALRDARARSAKLEGLVATLRAQIARLEAQFEQRVVNIVEEMLRANATATNVTKSKWRKLQMIIHPDTAATATEKERNEGFRILKALNLNIIDDASLLKPKYP